MNVKIWMVELGTKEMTVKQLRTTALDTLKRKGVMKQETKGGTNYGSKGSAYKKTWCTTETVSIDPSSCQRFNELKQPLNLRTNLKQLLFSFGQDM